MTEARAPTELLVSRCRRFQGLWVSSILFFWAIARVTFTHCPVSSGIIDTHKRKENPAMNTTNKRRTMTMLCLATLFVSTGTLASDPSACTPSKWGPDDQIGAANLVTPER
ncbi:MAG: hypothetical protein OEU36_25865, partial [Gammaproteobacteria bacterium]|nr:hypothetical protein [Gammaproteobacteria bacterium]